MKRITVKTVSSLALAACLLFVFMAGCSPSSSIAPTTNPPSAPTAGTPGAPTATAPAKQDFSGTTITMLRHSGYEADWMAEKFQKLKEETGITVVVEMVNYAQLHDKIVVDAAGGGGTYDIIATTDAWVGEFAGSGWLADLNPMFNDPTLYDANYNRDDVAASMFEANVVDGALYAIPWKFNNILMVYRSDLIPAPPETWDEYLQVVKDNTKDGVYGVGLSLSTTSIDTFLSLLCTNGGALLSEDNKTCLLDSPEAIETLEFIMELHKYAAPGSVSRHWDESGAILGQGVIATDIIINSQASNLYNPEKSNFVDELLFAPIPYKKNHGSISNTWGGAIMSNSKNKEAAFIALQYLTMPDLSKSMVTDVSGTTPVRMSLLEDQALIAEIPALKVEAEVIDACVSKPKVDTMAAITTIVASEIQNAINGVKTAEQAMKDAKALVEAEL